LSGKDNFISDAPLLTLILPEEVVNDLNSPKRLNKREGRYLSSTSEHSHINSGRRIIYINPVKKENTGFNTGTVKRDSSKKPLRTACMRPLSRHLRIVVANPRPTAGSDSKWRYNMVLWRIVAE